MDAMKWMAGFALLAGCQATGPDVEMANGADVVDAKPAEYIAAFNAPRGAVRLNQVGVFPNRPILAVVETDRRSPLAWTLKGPDGLTVSGDSEPFGYDEGSGARVHRITVPGQPAGEGYVLEVEGVGASHPFRIARDVYAQLKYDLLNYYYHNRADEPILAEYAGGEAWARPAGHPSEVLGCFKGEDRNGVEWPGCDYTLDVTGGWYDAGDQSKYMINSGTAVWVLQHMAEHYGEPFADGRVKIPEAGNGRNDLLDEARENLDFMLAMQAPEGAKVGIARGDYSNDPAAMKVVMTDVSGMAHHKAGDATWPTLPLFPHENTTPRVLHVPSVTATLHLAATGAQCARLYRDIDPAYAATCERAARTAWDAAKRVPDAYSYNNFDGSGPYDSQDARQESYWAAAELYLMDEGFKDELLEAKAALPDYPMSGSREGNWSEIDGYGTLALARSAPDAELRADALRALRTTADAYLVQTSQEGYAIPFSKEKWRWGSVGELANRGLTLASVYDLTGEARYRDGALDLLDYILGRNPRDTSYVSGYGTVSPKALHHRHWAGVLDERYPLPPPGAVSGGPNTLQVAGPVSEAIIDLCHAQTCFADHIDAYELNEVAINWQAAVFALATWADAIAQDYP